MRDQNEKVPATVFLDAITKEGYAQAMRWQFVHGNDILVAELEQDGQVVAACRDCVTGAITVIGVRSYHG